jgi:hypothetical protein
MNWPPMLIHIRIKNKDANFGLWLPLFLLVPLALAVFLVLSPLILIALIVLWWLGWGRMALLGLKAVFVTFWYLHGLKVDIQGRNETVFVSIV